jgi:hypothetical protein
MATIFERLARERPSTKEVISERAQKLQHAQKLLDWLQRWNKDTVCYRDIRLSGPYPRERESVISSANILVKYGWLVPLKPHRYDMYKWQVVRKLTIAPNVATLSE